MQSYSAPALRRWLPAALVSLCAAGIHAQTGGGVFIGLAIGADSAPQAAERRVRIDLDQFNQARQDALRAGGRLLLNIAAGIQFEAIIERTALTASGYSLSGRIGGVHAGATTWVVEGDLAMGTIWTPWAAYDVVPLDGGVHAIRKVDWAAARHSASR